MCTRLVPILTCISHVYPIGKPAINQIYLLTILCDNFHYIIIEPCILGLVQAITQRNTIIVPNSRMNEWIYTAPHNRLSFNGNILGKSITTIDESYPFDV